MQNLKWLTVKEACSLCLDMHLPRSTKSLRRWCAKEEIEAQKRQTSHGEKWFIDRESLEIKIKEELEFLKHSEKPLPHPEYQTGHSPDMSGYGWTSADITAHDRTRANKGAQDADVSDGAEMQDLRDQIMLLKHDIEWRSRLLKEQKQTTQILMDEVKGQSRYIGHLETNVLRLGGKNDLAFLAAPVPSSDRSRDAGRQTEIVTPEIIPNERPHPDQSSFYQNHSG